MKTVRYSQKLQNEWVSGPWVDIILSNAVKVQNELQS